MSHVSGEIAKEEDENCMKELIKAAQKRNELGIRLEGSCRRCRLICHELNYEHLCFRCSEGKKIAIEKSIQDMEKRIRESFDTRLRIYDRIRKSLTWRWVVSVGVNKGDSWGFRITKHRSSNGNHKIILWGLMLFISFERQQSIIGKRNG